MKKIFKSSLCTILTSTLVLGLFASTPKESYAATNLKNKSQYLTNSSNQLKKAINNYVKILFKPSIKGIYDSKKKVAKPIENTKNNFKKGLTDTINSTRFDTLK